MIETLASIAPGNSLNGELVEVGADAGDLLHRAGWGRGRRPGGSVRRDAEEARHVQQVHVARGRAVVVVDHDETHLEQRLLRGVLPHAQPDAAQRRVAQLRQRDTDRRAGESTAHGGGRRGHGGLPAVRALGGRRRCAGRGCGGRRRVARGGGGADGGVFLDQGVHAVDVVQAPLERRRLRARERRAREREEDAANDVGVVLARDAERHAREEGGEGDVPRPGRCLHLEEQVAEQPRVWDGQRDAVHHVGQVVDRELRLVATEDGVVRRAEVGEELGHVDGRDAEGGHVGARAVVAVQALQRRPAAARARDGAAAAAVGAGGKAVGEAHRRCGRPCCAVPVYSR
mmetsp:Transcript_7446/g.23278  ORF Transcript_7446/g.23278 Transcript_7446/m.23278 type:complete len:344 (-) Transcript_7446:80-1111(-)